jgi:catechol 2,3-dioxygenase-like lactoylglutathione lyase family enzyme
MFDHVGLKVTDLDASVRFYGAALAPLGIELVSRDEAGAGFGPAGAPALWLSATKPAAKAKVAPATVHLAFVAKSHGAVDAFHGSGREAGGRDNGAPGARPDYGPAYYAAFLLDPDGNNVEAVCTKERG